MHAANGEDWLPVPGVMGTRSRRIGARGLASLLRWCMHTTFHVEVRGLENFTCSPSTLVIANHRRDTDGPIIGTALAEHMLARDAGTVPCFVAREDLFRRGFLRKYLTGWPSPVRELLGMIDLRPFLDTIHLYPMRRIRERTLGEVLEDILTIFGDLPLREVLRLPWADQFQRLAGAEAAALSVSDVLHRRYRALLGQPFGLTKLTRARFHALRPHEEAVIQRQLRHFVDLLEHGAVVQLEPEGTTSSDGSLGRLRGGLHVMLNQPRTSVRVLPVGITYDFMTSARQWVFVNIGREILDLQGLPRRETTARVTEAMLACSTLTASQLASRLLLTIRERGGGHISRSGLDEHVGREAEHWAARGVRVDPRLLEPEARAQRIAEYLEYCRRSAALVPCGRGHYLVRRETQGPPPPPSWTQPDSALRYVHNELMSLTTLWPEVAGRGEL